MTTAQQLHLKRLNAKFLALNTAKYKAGTIEHSGNLSDVDTLTLLHYMREEIIDSFNYIQTAIDQMEDKL